MKLKRVIPFGLACGLLVAGAAFAESGGDYGYGTMADRQFARSLARGSVADVSMGRLAKSRAKHPEVREFASKIVSDHSRGSRILRDLADRRGWRLPTTPDPKHQAMRRRVARLQGSAFDRAYMQAMVDDHNRTVAMVRAYARDGDDPELRAWARKALPVLIEHQRMARSTAQEVM